MYKDKRGLQLTAANQEAVDAFDAAIDEYLGQGREAGVLLKQLGNADPDMFMAHIVRGYFNLSPAQPHLLAPAAESLRNAQAIQASATPREQMHLRVLEAWSSGNISGACRILEEILLEHPHDILAFRLAHYLYFYTGELARMRDSTARAMANWSESDPGYGYVLGCRAFSLEENGQYADAEPIGRRAVEINDNDIWAGHAVAHVMEMQGRRQEGIDWITTHEATWSKRGLFANHLWWHRTLHFLEMERYDDVLAAFDNQIWPKASEDNTDIANASSMLMRLCMLGVDVGDRWQSVADISATRIETCIRPFSDVHFMMALAMSGNMTDAERLLQVMRDHQKKLAEYPDSTLSGIYRDAGIPVADAILSYAKGQYNRAAEIMLEARYNMRGLGGSWAQRDCWERMLIDAAIRGGKDKLASALLAQRTGADPTSGPSWRSYGDVLERLGHSKDAELARARAANLLAA